MVEGGLWRISRSLPLWGVTLLRKGLASDNRRKFGYLIVEIALAARVVKADFRDIDTSERQSSFCAIGRKAGSVAGDGFEGIRSDSRFARLGLSMYAEGLRLLSRQFHWKVVDDALEKMRNETSKHSSGQDAAASTLRVTRERVLDHFGDTGAKTDSSPFFTLEIVIPRCRDIKERELQCLLLVRAIDYMLVKYNDMFIHSMCGVSHGQGGRRLQFAKLKISCVGRTPAMNKKPQHKTPVDTCKNRSLLMRPCRREPLQTC